ncbi:MULTISPECIES: bifunctional UDP-N-acetylmuramoyl-tripeptide:D-alanyl-D-alanine ligase/alanine racemase [unclassified Carboxylicivirga]|uniref:bifunctional UDP-N-acetylmuramoyl-tripeptide:D-alanyl-D-alanine ligase/alanine racemase n=1 Tax=Carboxylicivirga TaxID=1628153 RepID=UPI003D3511CE
MNYSLAQLATFASARTHGNALARVEKIVYDSRKTFVPNNTLFAAIRTESNDGHAYINTLYERGIRAFLVEEDAGVSYVDYPEAGFIICDDTITCLQAIAMQHRHSFTVPFVGITGSNGKTIVKEWLTRLLLHTHKVGRSPRSFNSQLGVPLSICMLPGNIDVALIEAGLSKPGEMEKLASCIEPEVGIFTNIGQAHQENFKDTDHKIKEKLKLFRSARVILFNGDDRRVASAITTHYPNAKRLSCGHQPGNSLRVIEQITSNNITHLTLNWQGDLLHISSPYQDAISIDNLILSILAALELGVPPEAIKKECPHLQPIAMRLEQKEGINNCLLIDDGYNADLTSLELALDFLNQMGTKSGLSKTLILSDIQQSGVNDKQLYERIQQLSKEKGISKFIGIGKVLYRAMGGTNAYPTTESFLEQIDINGFKNEAILLKGARNFAFERISALLEQRRHKTVLEINLNALTNNLQYYRSKLHKSTKTLAMVKAYSYGTGAFEIANLLQHQKVDYLGVAFADEGIELRKAGITLPIIVMNPELSSFPMMLNYELEPEIYSFEVLKAFINAVQREGLTRVPVHIKLDTGMHRLGFLTHEVDRLIQCLKEAPQLRVCSAFSHLAGSDEAQHDDFTRSQIDAFKSLCSHLQKQLGYPFLRHILNSAGIERFPDAQFDMVRLGIGMYGISSIQAPLTPVNTLKTYISQLKTVEQGYTIGYGRKGKAKETTRIAVIPIGYADGFNRRLSNGKGYVLINGRQARIVGNVCMDMCMADVSHIDAKEGDVVEIFGCGIRVEELADTLDTIPYEILTGISRRVKRVYVME